ncbi:hypothetical protein [Streptomyces sp. NPDC005281]|uniref:hypothetical protein n=1 Tax=Streptomyces sp. NPDC005281 TaxID=3155712 RepID=UPI0033B90F72
MGTPSAMPSGPGSWVRGPRNPQGAPAEARPAAPEAEGTGRPTAPQAPAPQAPAAQAPTAPTTAAAPAAPVTAAVLATTAVPVVPVAPTAPAAGAPTPGVGPASSQVHPEQPVFAAAPEVRTAPQTVPRPKPASSRSAPGRRTASAPAPEPSWGRPKRPRTARGTSRDEVGWVKAHGGSGATSLAEAFGGVEVGARWPDPARGEPRRVVLVGRTNARGLRSVSQALGALKDGDAPQGLELLGVVLVADAPGRLPLGLLRRIRVLRSVARVHRVPWIPAWRTGGRPKSVPRQLATLAALVGADLYGEGAVS